MTDEEYGFWLLVAFLLFCACFTLVVILIPKASASIISINSGGSTATISNPDKATENFFFGSESEILNITPSQSESSSGGNIYGISNTTNITNYTNLPIVPTKVKTKSYLFLFIFIIGLTLFIILLGTHRRRLFINWLKSNKYLASKNNNNFEVDLNDKINHK